MHHHAVGKGVRDGQEIRVPHQTAIDLQSARAQRDVVVDVQETRVQRGRPVVSISPSQSQRVTRRPVFHKVAAESVVDDLAIHGAVVQRQRAADSSAVQLDHGGGASIGVQGGDRFLHSVQVEGRRVIEQDGRAIIDLLIGQ